MSLKKSNQTKLSVVPILSLTFLNVAVCLHKGGVCTWGWCDLMVFDGC